MSLLWLFVLQSCSAIMFQHKYRVHASFNSLGFKITTVLALLVFKNVSGTLLPHRALYGKRCNGSWQACSPHFDNTDVETQGQS